MNTALGHGAMLFVKYGIWLECGLVNVLCACMKREVYFLVFKCNELDRK